MSALSLSRALACAAGLIAATGAAALGFGPVPDTVTFGQPLRLAVPLRLAPGESLDPGCTRATVLLGEQPLPPAAVQLQLEPAAGGATLRLSSTTVVLEPMVTVDLSVGCGRSAGRRFVVLADPPRDPAPSPLLAEPARVAAAPVAAAAPGAAHSAPPDPGADRAAAAPVPPLSPALLSAPVSRAAAAPVTRPSRKTMMAVTSAAGTTSAAAAAAAASTRTATAAGAPRRAAPPSARAARQPLAARRPQAASTMVAARRVAEPERARLQLDGPDASLQAAALVAAQSVVRLETALADASRAATAAQAAASAAQAQLAAAQAAVLKLQQAADGSRQTSDRLRAQLATAQARSRWLLLALLAALAGLAGWYGWRLVRLRSGREATWWQAAEVPPAAQGGAPHAHEAAALRRAVLQPQSVLPASTLPPPLAAAALPAADGVPAHAVRPAAAVAGQDAASVDELIDLEQQAEFFLVLGEEEAAIDLLVAHLRSSGGASPLPYLKLLEIYHQRGDREAYARIRSRFNQRFNAHAPVADAGPSGRRGLLDYPAVVAALQQHWLQPLDAMAELEAQLYRRGGGEVFDLPAYRELLLLYAVARDRLLDDGDAAPPVDLLLPLAAGPDEALADEPFVSAVLPSRPMPLDERPTAAVDLELGPQRAEVQLPQLPAG